MSAAQAQVQLPQPVGYVNDFADVIPADTEQRIERIIDEVRAKSGGEIVVVTLPSLEGRPLDEVALRIGREWQIGSRGEPGDPARNTGLVVLVVPKETSPDGRGYLKIETGLGTSTFITAGRAGQIADNLMVPEFQRGDYGNGILLGVAALAHAYADRFGFELTGDVPQVEAPPVQRRGIPLGLLMLILLFIFILLSGGGRGGRGRRSWLLLPLVMGGRRGWGRGGFGGGGFGGGGFGGGGFGGFGGSGGFGGGGVGRSW